MPQLSLKPATSGVRFSRTSGVRLRSATGTPSSYDATTRSFEFVLASERPCRTWRIDDAWRVTEVDEILPMRGLVDLEDFVGASILTDHRYWGPPIGVIEEARIEGDKLVCRGRLSMRPDVEDIASDIQSGIRRSFSIGFEILEDGEARTTRKGDVPTITVRKWRAKEASLVSVPADDTAKIRSATGAPRHSSTRSSTVDAETFRTRFAETFAERMTAFADELADSIVTLISEDDGAGDETAAPAKKGERSAETPPAPSAAAQAAQIRSLREACKRNGREAEFKALADSGADIAELRSLLVASIRTSAEEIDTTQKPASGKRGGGLVAFSETARGGKAAK